MSSTNLHKNPSDAEIQESFETLVTESEKWIRMAAQKMTPPVYFQNGTIKKVTYDVDDFIQEGLMAAWIAYPRYYSERKKNPSIIQPSVWLYYTVLRSCQKVTKKTRSQRDKTFYFPDDIFRNAKSLFDEDYDFDYDVTLQDLNAAISTLPDRERGIAISYLKSGCNVTNALALLDKELSESTYRYGFTSAIELIKVKMVFMQNIDDLGSLKKMSVPDALQYAVQNSKESLCFYSLHSYEKKLGHTSRIGIYNEFIDEVRLVLKYMEFTKPISSLSSEDCELLVKKLALSKETGGNKNGKIFKLRFLLERLKNMGVLSENPIPITNEYNRNKLQPIKGALSDNLNSSDYSHLKLYGQYDLKNNFLRYYETIEGIVGAGFNRQVLNGHLRGVYKKCGGFIWKEEGAGAVSAYYSKSGIAEMVFNKSDIAFEVPLHRLLYPTIKQFDLAGNFVSEFSTYSQIENMGYNPEGVKSSIRHGFVYQNFIWSRDQKPTDDQLKIAAKHKASQRFLKRTFKQFSFDGELIQQFDPSKTPDFGFTKTGIYNAISNNTAYRGFLWSYDDQLSAEALSKRRYSKKSKAV